MFIHEAILATTKEEPFITRQAWSYDMGRGKPLPPAIVIFPTDTPDCCIIASRHGRAPRRGWQPTAGDLIADDWMIAKGV